jgi:hypothetical protein
LLFKFIFYTSSLAKSLRVFLTWNTTVTFVVDGVSFLVT